MTLKPKRIIFTKNSISPDGVGETQAKLTFLTGSSGDWFTGNPQWSIIGDTLGCTIDPNTGWIRAGTETGEITVQATDSPGHTGNYLSGALKIGCQACASGSCGIGAGICADLRNALSVSLGVLPCDDSYMGSIRLKLANPPLANPPSATLDTRAGLTYDQTSTDNALPEILNDTIGNYSTPLRQVLAPQCLADIVTISSTEYEVRLYSPENKGTLVNGYFQPTGSPFKVWRVMGNTWDNSGNVTSFTVTEDPAGANIANTFTWNATDKAWTLNRNNLRQEEKVVLTGLATNPSEKREVSGSVSSETTKISTPGSSSIVSVETKTYATLTLSLNGGTLNVPNVLVEDRFDGHNADGSAANPDLVTDYFYGPNATSNGHPELERVTNSDGSWEHYSYDTQGRVTDVYQPWLDSQPPTDIDTVPSGVPIRHTQYNYTTLANSGDSGAEQDTPRTTRVYVDTTGSNPQLTSQSWVVLTTDTTDYPQLQVRKDIQVHDNSATWDSPAGSGTLNPINLVTTNRTFTSGSNQGQIQSIDRPDGTRTVYSYKGAPDSDGQTMDTVETVYDGAAGSGFSVTDGRTTITTTTSKGFVKSTIVEDIATGNKLVDDVWSGTPDAHGRFPTLTHLDNTKETYTYDCCTTTQIVGRNGETTVFAPDALNRIWSTTVLYSGSSVQTENTLDAAGNVTKKTRIGTDASGSSSIDVVPLNQFDRAARVDKEENALTGVTTITEAANASGGREVTTTYPDGGTRIEDYHRDDRLAKVTGTAVQPAQYDYGVDPSTGELYMKETKLDTSYNPTPEWTQTYTDFEGHGHKTVYPDSSYSQQYYANNGQLWKERDPDGVLTVYIYGDRGEVDYTEVGLKNEPTTPPMTPPDTSGGHRITLVTNFVGSYVDNSITYPTLVTEVAEWTTIGSSANIVTSESYASLDGLRQWNVAFPNETYKQVTKFVTTYGVGGSRTVTNTFPDNSYQVSSYSYGRLVSVTRYDFNYVQWAGTSYQYDQQGRILTSTDMRNGTTSGYNNADQITSTTSPAPGDGSLAQTQSTGYDNMGRLIQVTEPDGGIVYTRYYQNGLVKLTWGTRTYPAGYEYDAQGRLAKLHTWRSFAAPDPSNMNPAFPSGYVTTTWNYDPSRGWLINKRYPDNTGPDYTYTPGGRLKTREWARLVPGTSTRLTATYVYDFDASGLNANYLAGYLAQIQYNDGSVPAGEISTPSLSYTYDRRGRGANVVQGSSSPITTTLVWHDSGALDQESYGNPGGVMDTLSVKTVNVDPSTYLLRRQSLEADKGGTAITGTTVNYSYDGTSRLWTLTSGGYSVTYWYGANLSLVDTATFRQGTTTRLTTTSKYDFLNRVQSITPAPAASTPQPPLSRTYAYNKANQRVRRIDGDSSYWSYNYDAEGQLTWAKHYWYDNQPVPGQQFQFSYDAVGNWLTSSEGGDASGNNLRQASYTPNNLNQYSSRNPDRSVDLMGLALVQNGVPTTVTINGAAPDYRRGEYFWKKLTGSGSGPNWLNVNVVDGSPSVSGNVYLPPQTESPGYDLDGNQASDARWVYKWDAENRLARMDTQVSAAATGIPAKRIQYIYDYQGRMIRRQVFSGTYSGGTITWNSTPDSSAGSDLIFMYDGFECIAALNPNQTFYQAYVWGVDESGTLSDAGGVGGLVMMSTTTGTYFPTYDGNGNVTGLVNGNDGTLVARYEYGPFGGLLRMSGGALASSNPFRFSSKWQDNQSDLLYYGFRFYSPGTGRWLSRDPLQELGGINMLAFVNNNPISSVDYNGTIGLDTLFDLGVLVYDISTEAGAATIISDAACLLVPIPVIPPSVLKHLPEMAKPINVVTRIINGKEQKFQQLEKAGLRATEFVEFIKGEQRTPRIKIQLEYKGLVDDTGAGRYGHHFQFINGPVGGPNGALQYTADHPADSQWAKGYNDDDVKDRINTALKAYLVKFPQPTYSTLNGFIYDFKIPGGGDPYSEAIASKESTVGYTGGQCTSKIKLDVGTGGEIHAYPVP